MNNNKHEESNYVQGLDLEELKLHILEMVDNDLLEYVESKFCVDLTKNFSEENKVKRIKLLDNLDKDIRNVGIARMKRAQELNNTVTYIPFFIGFMVAMLTAYSQLFGEFKQVAGFAGIIITSIIFSLLVKLLYSSRRKKGIAIYFQSLLETVNNNERDK